MNSRDRNWHVAQVVVAALIILPASQLYGTMRIDPRVTLSTRGRPENALTWSAGSQMSVMSFASFWEALCWYKAPTNCESREGFDRYSSNRSLQPTPSRLDSFFFMIKTLPQLAKRAVARRG